MTERAEQRVVVLTGSGRREGMGRAIAERFLDLGDIVILSDLGAVIESHPEYEVAPRNDLAAAVSELGERGTVRGIACDVTNEDQVRALFSEVVAEFGRVDVVVNCAGLAIGLRPITELSLLDWKVNMDVMATGAFLCAREAARKMVERGTRGRIITISSTAGKTGQALLAAYSAAKFAVIGLTQSMATELGPKGITVNAICPGVIETPLLAVKGGVYETFSSGFGRTEDEYRARLIRTIPARRLGTVADVASAAVFLASAEASFVTGEALNVTGGQEVH